jgi:FtsH-binding integral membrane protein
MGKAVAVQPIGLSGIGMRFLFAFLLVVFTWNPTGVHYVQWVLDQFDPVERSNLWPVVAFAGIILLGGWIFFLRTLKTSLGTLGIVLYTGLAVVILWALFRYNIVTSESKTLISWIVLILFSGMLAIGMSWSHLRARWSGQATVDEVEGR